MRLNQLIYRGSTPASTTVTMPGWKSCLRGKGEGELKDNLDSPTKDSDEYFCGDFSELSLGVSKSPNDRVAFTNSFQFFLSTIGDAIGLGNIVRFPYKVMQSGGGEELFLFFPIS